MVEGISERCPLDQLHGVDLENIVRYRDGLEKHLAEQPDACFVFTGDPINYEEARVVGDCLNRRANKKCALLNSVEITEIQ